MTPWGLLQRRIGTDGASPLVTMYDDATGERTELSAVSLGNWVAKTANLLVDDLDVEPGEVVSLELPAHWQSLVLAVAVCAVGGRLGGSAGNSPGDGGRVRAVTEDTAAAADDDTIVLSLRPMGAGRLTPGPGVDYAAEIRLHGDYFPGGDGATHPAPIPGFPAGARVMTTEAELGPAFATLLGALAVGGSLVLVRHEDPSTRERRIATERVTQVS